MTITKQIVASKIAAYLRHEISLAELVDWAEDAMMEGNLLSTKRLWRPASCYDSVWPPCALSVWRGRTASSCSDNSATRLGWTSWRRDHASGGKVSGSRPGSCLAAV